MSLYDNLTEIFRDTFDNDEITATPELTAYDVEEWDSLSHIRVIVAIEETFGIRFAVTEITELQNVGEMAALIEKKIA
jgi:acyl carrier protein